MARVVISQSLPPMAVNHLRGLLDPAIEIVEAGGRPDAELQAALGGAAVMIGQTFTAAMGTAGTGLKLVQAQGAGTDGIERAALPAGCFVANCYEHDISIAEFIIGMALAASRGIVEFDRNLRAKDDFSPSGFYGGIPRLELRGRTMGIVGYGRIGQEAARLARAFGMRVVATKGRPDASLAERDGLAWLGGSGDLGRLLAEADFVVICTPLVEATRGLIGAAQFAAMKPDAFLINIARGPVVDEQALFDALRDRTIAGAAIDVWYSYPKNGVGRPSELPFETLDNLVMTPHVAGWTEGTVRRRVEVMAENIRLVLSGQEPRNLVAVGAPR